MRKPRVIGWRVSHEPDGGIVNLSFFGIRVFGLQITSTVSLTQEQARKIGESLVRYGSRP